LEWKDPPAAREEKDEFLAVQNRRRRGSILTRHLLGIRIGVGRRSGRRREGYAAAAID
jgi:hypothetical protein